MNESQEPGRLSGDVPTPQDREACRSLVWRYMELCDVPAVERSESAMIELLTPNAEWDSSSAASGAVESRRGAEAIAQMLFTHIDGATGFVGNRHWLDRGELVLQSQTTMSGTWLMFRASVRRNEEFEFVLSRLHVWFRKTTQGWRIARYQPVVLVSDFQSLTSSQIERKLRQDAFLAGIDNVSVSAERKTK